MFTPPAQAPPVAAPMLVANPTLRFDVASGLVVIEFHDAAGDVTTSVPTLRQLEAYRVWGQPTPGPPPPSQASPGKPSSGHSSPGQPAVGQPLPGEPSPGQPPPAAGVHVSATSEV